MAKVLTDKFIKAKAAIPPRGRKDWRDAVVPGLALRASASGHRSYVLVARYPLHPKHPTRRALGDAGVLTLDQARDKARRWLELISKGVDPKTEDARARASAKRAQAATFSVLWQAFWDASASKLAKADEAKRAGTAFVRQWGGRPAGEIEAIEISTYIRELARETPSEARNRFGHLRRCYSWAIGSGGFGLTGNPCSVLRPADLVGAKRTRDRVLTDDEIRSIWDAAGRMGYPYGLLFRFLLLTGQREMEAAGASWSEIDLDAALWVVPAHRMKMERAHLVPLAPDALALLYSLPRFASGDFLFSMIGAAPLNGFSRVKRRLDALSGVTGWIFHDLRRSMRTHLSALPIEDRVREAMIAHAAPQLHRVYSLHDWADEKRRGFELWEARLRGILSPRPPAADLEAERGKRAVV